MSAQNISQAVRSEDGAVICERMRVARSWWARFRGLLGTDRLDAGEGLWLSPCGSVHTAGMRYAIDVVFLDRELRVTRIVPNLRPRRACFGPRATRSTLELPAGAAAGLGLSSGDQLRFTEHAPVSSEQEARHVH